MLYGRSSSEFSLTGRHVRVVSPVGFMIAADLARRRADPDEESRSKVKRGALDLARMVMPEPEIRDAGGKYRLIVELGQGGTAVVYLAVARGPGGFNKLVVLKMMKRALLAEPELAEMFMNEARLSARLNHPNIVETNEVFEQDGIPVIVMQYLEGQPLSMLVTRAEQKPDKFPLAWHLRVISEALAGLHHSHDLADYDGTPLNLVHRDMTPHNVFVTYEGQVKILDFGIAKINRSAAQTEVGVIKGKLRYMPPEQLTGEGVDRRSDIFAVGVMLWEAAARQRMWRGLTDPEVMHAILNNEIPKPSSIVPDMPPRLEAIIMKAMARDPAARHATAAALQAELDEYLAELGSNARNRDIGAVVGELFADVRADTRRVVDQQLRKVTALSAREYQSFRPLELASTVSSAEARERSEGRTIAAPATKNRALAAAVAIPALALLAFVLWPSKGNVESPPAATPPVAAVRAAATTPAMLTVKFGAVPNSARLFLDDREMTGNPVTLSVPTDGSRHTLRAEAAGYEMLRREVTYDRNQELSLTLTPVPAAPPKPVAKEARRAPRPARAKCDPPYVIDQRGVKKYKPECL
jgi:eukaryotic-like serine/threonine-protein kinase